MSLLTIEKMIYAQAKTLGYTLKPENVPYNIDNEATPFIEVYSLPNGADELYKGTRDEYSGIYQLSVYTDIDAGRGASINIIDDITGAFRPGTELNDSDTKLIVDGVSLTQGRVDGNHYRSDVSINYIVFAGA